MPESVTFLESSTERSRATAFLTAGWLWGLVATVVLYAVIPYIPDPSGTIARYLTAHWIEYAAIGLFCIGMGTLIERASSLPWERAALSSGFLRLMAARPGEDALAAAQRVGQQLQKVAPQHLNSVLGRRTIDVCNYVLGRRNTEGLEAHLGYLADTAAVRLNGSYAFIRTITWAIPILGFLGTVIGITLSIANITPDQLESSLNEVTGGLAVAFDTTALSLGLSMVLVFSTFVVERQEQQILDAVEDTALQSLAAVFPTLDSTAQTGPLLQAEQAAAQQLLDKTEAFVAWQMEAWQLSLEAVRSRWLTTLEQQQTAAEAALETGLRAALVDHTEQLANTRNEFVRVFEAASNSIQSQLQQSQQQLQDQHAANLEALALAWADIRQDLTASADQHHSTFADFSTQLRTEVQSWHEQLRQVHNSMEAQSTELRQHGETLLRLSEQESQLIRLEDRLAQNLETVKVVDTLDETLLSLNAAVNLLSAKNRSKAA